MSEVISSPATCFGKIPSRGDFVKGNGQHHLIGILDQWVSQAMEHLSEDPRWKIAYDAATAIDFAFVGARSRVSVVGHLRPSTDSSGRRFPFITAATVTRDDSLMFRCAPVGLARSFATLAHVAHKAMAGAEVPSLLGALDEIDCAGDFDVALQADPLGNFVRRTTLDELARMLDLPGSQPLRRIILAIGLLLRPVVGQGNIAIDKDLVLPLPAEETQRHLVAGMWLYLVTAFLRRSSIELQVVIARKASQPRLVIGFNGASPMTLLEALAPETFSGRNIVLADPEWVEEQVELNNDYGVAKLSSYLDQPGLNLETAIATFREVFLGE